jgi:hypothetical protein
MKADKAQYLPHEIPAFTVTISNPTDQALEVPVPFEPRETDFTVVGLYRETCGESFGLPPTTKLLPSQFVTKQMSGIPNFATPITNVRYGFSFMGNLVFTEVLYPEAIVRSRVAVELSWPSDTANPRVATVLTIEVGGRHFLAVFPYAQPLRYTVGQRLGRGDFMVIKLLEESNLPIQLLAVNESPANSLRLDFRTGNATEPKQIQLPLSNAPDRILN